MQLYHDFEGVYDHHLMTLNYLKDFRTAYLVYIADPTELHYEELTILYNAAVENLQKLYNETDLDFVLQVLDEIRDTYQDTPVPNEPVEPPPDDDGPVVGPVDPDDDGPVVGPVDPDDDGPVVGPVDPDDDDEPKEPSDWWQDFLNWWEGAWNWVQDQDDAVKYTIYALVALVGLLFLKRIFGG